MSSGIDPRLLRFYNDELAYLREEARAFGEEHEAVAGRLGLKTPTDPDPYVERLLEGVAYSGNGARTDSLVMRGLTGTVRHIIADHSLRKLDLISSIQY